MQTNYRVMGDLMVYRMPRDVDHHCAGKISGEMDRMIEHHGIRRLILDFSDTDFMDSSGIGLIIGRSRLLKFFQGEMKVSHLSERIKRIFCASGLHKIVNFEMEDVRE